MRPQPWARFDDLAAGHALMFPPPQHVLTTTRPQEVLTVLDEVHTATASGAWAFGYLAYEAAPGLDASLAARSRNTNEPPLIWFGLGQPPMTDTPIRTIDAPRSADQWKPDCNAAEHAHAVTRARDNIAAGEIYQCNLTTRLRTRFTAEPLLLYAELANAQQAAYNAYLDLGQHVIVSASPELFFEWVDDRIRTRPMKGTAPRVHDPADDHARAVRLQRSAKEQAENIMIVDLLRNDLAKFAVLGTVRVTELLALERYPTVWQLTSEIEAHTPPGCSLSDIFRALFPCGSVTGAPKARSMQVIRELETTPRGVYCGAVGFIAPPSATVRARFNVAIRTAVIDRASATGVYGAGGGITWSSDPAAEWAELLTKATLLNHRTTPASAATNR
ncbi:aminodeoxychorismate synthase component I [Actinoplanes sp. CA-054009]